MLSVIKDPDLDNPNVDQWESGKGVINLDEVKKKLDYSFKYGKDKGEKTHFHPIDEIRNFTWKRGFMYCITGVPGSGKSELINQLAMLKSYYDKWRWKIYSPESYPVEDIVDTFIHSLIGKSTDPDYSNQMSEKEMNIAFKWVKEYFDFVDFEHMANLDDVLVGLKNYDGIIIDPFNSLDDGEGNISSFLKKNLTKIKIEARKNNCVCVLIEHPHDANSKDDQGNPLEPSQYTLNGGAMWRNKCDVIGVVHRPLMYSEPMATNVTFRTRKIKNQKLNGFPGLAEFSFNRNENRYFWRGDQGREITGFDNDIKPDKELFDRATNYEGYNPEAGF